MKKRPKISLNLMEKHRNYEKRHMRERYHAMTDDWYAYDRKIIKWREERFRNERKKAESSICSR